MHDTLRREMYEKFVIQLRDHFKRRFIDIEKKSFFPVKQFIHMRIKSLVETPVKIIPSSRTKSFPDHDKVPCRRYRSISTAQKILSPQLHNSATACINNKAPERGREGGSPSPRSLKSIHQAAYLSGHSPRAKRGGEEEEGGQGTPGEKKGDKNLLGEKGKPYIMQGRKCPSPGAGASCSARAKAARSEEDREPVPSNL